MTTEQKNEPQSIYRDSNIEIEQDSERPTESANNNNSRYTKVDNDFLFNPTGIEGYDGNPNLNVEDNQNENNPEAILKSEKENETNQAEQNINKDMPNKSPLFNTQKKIHELKIIVLGDIAVGKTCVINRYIKNTFSDEHKSSISCEFKNKKMDIDCETAANLHIWDTAGEERFMSVTRQYYNGSHGAMIIYDLTNKDSFIKMSKWIKDVKDNAPRDIIISIVGNKSDLIAEKVDLGNELKPYQDKYLYCEVSAKTGTNVSLAFENLTLKIMDKLKEKKDNPDNSLQRDSIPLTNPNKNEKKKKCHC